MSLRPPSGAPPPAIAEIGGRRVDLSAVAGEICGRYYEQYPDEQQRYGSAGAEWCRHDNQWLLSWAVDDLLGATDLGQQVSWLAGVLHARDFPVSRLAHNLRIAAELIAEGSFGEASRPVAARLEQAAATVAALDFGGDSPSA